MRTPRALAFACLVIMSGHAAAMAAMSDHRLPPSPYDILGIRLDAPALDPIAVCLGPEPTLATARKALEESGPAAAISELDPADGVGEDRSDAESQLAVAILRARNAAHGSDGSAARQRLSDALTQRVSLGAIACGWLELARLELRIGRIPEARVTASRALRLYDGDEAPSSIERAASFYRAESLAGTGDTEAALEIYERLAQGKGPVARASQQRLADAKQDHSPSGSNRLELERLVRETPKPYQAAWAPRLAELAIAEGEYEAAKGWLDLAVVADFERSNEFAAAIAIRRADLLYRDEKRSERNAAHKILRELSESGESDAIQRLALIREIDLRNHWSEGSVQRLERAFDRGNGRISAYAAEVLARGLLATSRFEEALETLVELVHRRADVPGERIDAVLFDPILTALSTNNDCDAWIENVSGRRDLLMRHASGPDPFLRLGDCYQQVGMAAAALETYRGIAKSFGPTSVSSVTLRSAQAEFQLGRLATARAAARANVRARVEPRDAWRLLYARILLSDGQANDAFETLRPVLRGIVETTTDEQGPDGNTAILLGAQAAVSMEPSTSNRALLRRAIARRPTEGDSFAVLAEASVITADLHRLGGEFDFARDLYTPGLTHPENGVLRSRSAYWLGVLAPHPDEARAFWSRVTEDDDPWARLAINEIALLQGRAEVGHPLLAPESRLTRSDEGDSR